MAVSKRSAVSSAIVASHHASGEEGLGGLAVVVEAGERAAGAAVVGGAAATRTLDHSAVLQLNATRAAELKTTQTQFRTSAIE